LRKTPIFSAENWQNEKKRRFFAENWQNEKKRRFFRRKLAKIAEKCDHNIGPWSLQHFRYTINDVYCGFAFGWLKTVL
jgi:hypothetical protein